MPELFYDCGAYGLFTLDTERWQPTYRGKASSSEDFKPDPSAPINDPTWKTFGPIIEALDGKVHVLDVGGYIGTFTIPLALEAERRGYHLTFDTFEPGPTRNVLAKNIAINGLADRVRLHDAAMSGEAGRITYRWRGNGAIGGQIMGEFDTDNAREVLAVTIDDVCRDMDGPLLIKLDTQGHEGSIMSAAAETIAAKKAVWQIEFIKSHVWKPFKGTGHSFSDYLPTDFFVFDQGKQITLERMPEFVASLVTRQFGMADLILVPKEAPFTERVIAAL